MGLERGEEGKRWSKPELKMCEGKGNMGRRKKKGGGQETQRAFRDLR